MQQRVALVRALALGAPLLAMDEPLAALDEITRSEMRGLINQLVEGRGVTTMFVTHSIAEAVALSDRVLVTSHRPARIIADIDDRPAPAPLRRRRRRSTLLRALHASPPLRCCTERTREPNPPSRAGRRTGRCSSPRGKLLVRAFDIRPFVLATPSRIVRYLARFPDDYLRAALITLKHAALGYAVAVFVALVIGAAMAASGFVEQATQPVLTLIAVTPFAAYIASVKIGLGLFSDEPVVFIVALVSLPAFAFATADGMRSADPSSRELLASVDASRWEVLWQLRLPSALPSLFTAAKYNIGLALIVAYLAEGGNRRARRDRQQGRRRQPGRPAVGRDLVDGDSSAPSA